MRGSLIIGIGRIMMISILLEYKWWILLSCELIAWAATFYMFYAMYWLKSNLQFIIAGLVALLTGYVPHITLAFADFLKYREINSFLVVVVILFVFGITIGRKYISKIESKIKNWAIKHRQPED